MTGIGRLKTVRLRLLRCAHSGGETEEGTDKTVRMTIECEYL